jgi:peptidyl-prolyl cis-trans isomerase B (cyclophilin B)
MRLPLLLLLISAPLAVAACGGGGNSATPGTTAKGTGACTSVARPADAARSEKKPSEPLDASKSYDVTIETNCGSFTIHLDPEQSPHVTAAFVALVDAGYFDKTIFHRIVPGFVIQGGDPTGTGTGGPGFTTVDKPPAGAKYTHGVVAMAKTATEAAGTAGSQFFIVTGDEIGLPPDYAIIGTIRDGLDVVDRIGKLGDPNTEQPTRVVEIEKATVSSS